MSLEREQHVNDGGTTWTLKQRLPGGRSIEVQWYGPTHAYHPDTPDMYRKGWSDES